VPPGYAPEPGATVAWAPPPVATGSGIPVPGAPGLQFARVLDRFLAWLLDGFIVGFAAAITAGILVSLAPGTDRTTSLLTAVISLGVGFLYFVGLWTSAGRATIGMRLFKLQVGNAFDGRTLTMQQAVRRWLALGLPLQSLSILPDMSSAVGSIVFLWSLALLVSTAISPTRQGLHDRFANSAIVQPMGASTPAFACLVLLLLLVVLPLVAIVALIFLGGQVSTILSPAG
jgi:uncharacterized RDD family membrane protein YckC